MPDLIHFGYVFIVKIEPLELDFILGVILIESWDIKDVVFRNVLD